MRVDHQFEHILRLFVVDVFFGTLPVFLKGQGWMYIMKRRTIVVVWITILICKPRRNSYQSTLSVEKPYHESTRSLRVGEGMSILKIQ